MIFDIKFYLIILCIRLIIAGSCTKRFNRLRSRILVLQSGLSRITLRVNRRKRADGLGRARGRRELAMCAGAYSRVARRRRAAPRRRQGGAAAVAAHAPLAPPPIAGRVLLLRRVRALHAIPNYQLIGIY